MRATANLAVKGTRYYKAADLLQRGSLPSGLAIRLEHQPNNPHDKNAVAVCVKRTGAMLGYVSKDLALKYASLIHDRKIITANIASAEKNGKYVNIDIQVIYEQSREQMAEKHSSRFWRSSCSLLEKPGVYAIKNIDSERQYVGSSNNVKDRIRSHIRDLSLGCHANHPLQFDFSRLGANNFEAKMLVSDIYPPNLALSEANQITLLLNSGAALYNLTADGQGIGPNTSSHTNSAPISDRLAKQAADTERRRVDEIFLKRIEAVHSTFDKKLATLLPVANFWAYFVGTFVITFIVLAIVIPKIKETGLSILSGILALIVSPLLRDHIQAKARQSAQYQSLIQQRHEQLCAIDDERTKARTS